VIGNENVEKVEKVERVERKELRAEGGGILSGINDVLVVSCPQCKSQGMKMLRRLRRLRGLRKFRGFRRFSGLRYKNG